MCNVEKPLEAFRSRGGSMAHLLKSRCNTCLYAEHKKWAEDNPDRIREYRNKDSWTLAKRCARRGITPEQLFDRYERQEECCAICKDEIKIIEKLLKECYELAEPTRLKHKDGTPYTDEEMFEVNAANEFTVLLAREMQAEVIANGRPSAAKIKNAMSNPLTWTALKNIGLIPQETPLIASNIDPTTIQLNLKDDPIEAIEHKKSNTQIERKDVKFL
jgi:hypothetical protein